MKTFPFKSFHLLEAACGPYEWLLELLIPKVLIPKIGRNSHHHVFCYSSESGNSVKRLKSDPGPDDKNQEAPSCVSLGSTSLSGPSIHCPSAAVCIGILPGLGAYSGSSDSESSSDSEGTINATGKIVSSIFRTNTFLEAP